MAWMTEKRYKRYEDWTQEELQQIKENIAKSPGGLGTVLPDGLEVAEAFGLGE